MMMYGITPLEFVVTPKTTYVLVNFLDPMRRIYTDNRTMPDDTVPSFQGYSTGRWVDQDGDGVYDVLEVETRNFKGPRFYDEAGIPIHTDDKTVFKERIYLDKSDRQRPARRDHDDRSRAHPSVDGDQELSPRRERQAGVARIQLRREQPARRDRGRQLLPQCRRPADAGSRGLGAAGPEVFQAGRARHRSLRRERWRRTSLLRMKCIAPSVIAGLEPGDPITWRGHAL